MICTVLGILLAKLECSTLMGSLSFSAAKSSFVVLTFVFEALDVVLVEEAKVLKFAAMSRWEGMDRVLSVDEYIA
jgi:hypothetical protein